MSRLLYTDAIHCVLAWLPLRDALPAMLSCRAWYRAAQTEPSRDLAIVNHPFTSELTACAVRSTLGRGRHVRSILLLWRGAVHATAWRTVCSSDAVRALSVSPTDPGYVIADLPRALTSLTLAIGHGNYTTWLNKLWTACARLAHLTHFAYDGPQPVLARVWSTMPRLESLALHQLDFASDWDWSRVPDTLRTLQVPFWPRGAPRLPSRITRVVLTHATFDSLDALPRDLPHLTLEPTQPLVEVARRLPRLQTLEMSGGFEPYASLCPMSAPPTLAQLTSLTLRGVPLSAFDLEAAMRIAPNLRTLVLDGYLRDTRMGVPIDEVEHAGLLLRSIAASRIASLHLTYRHGDRWSANERCARLHTSVAKALLAYPTWRIEVLPARCW
jgi:hypothetical protein